jgi:hypothetical protein
MTTFDAFLDLSASQLPSELSFLDVELLADQTSAKASSFGTLGSFSTVASGTAPSSGSSLSSASTWSPA